MILNWQLFLEELVGESPIVGLDSYISGMNTTIQDKLFFADKINYDAIVDFGCADGTFLLSLSKIKHNLKIVGYDLDTTMLSIAENKLKNAILTDNWHRAVGSISGYKNPLLNLSSVIHEVYSYSHGS